MPGPVRHRAGQHAADGTHHEPVNPLILLHSGIVAEITPRAAGTYTLTGVRLTLRLNGGGAQTMEGIDSVVTICAADAPPTDCGPTPPP